MKLFSNKNFDNGWEKDLTSGTYAQVSGDVYSLTASGGPMRRTRWVRVREGQKIRVSVEMGGDSRVKMILYTSIGYSTEVNSGQVSCDSYGMKRYYIDYVIPLGSGITNVGLAIYVENGGVGYYTNPSIDLLEGNSCAPTIVAHGTVDFTAPAFDKNYSNHGCVVTTSSTTKVRIILSPFICKGASLLPYAVATEATPAASVNAYKLVCSDMFVNTSTGQTYFDLYFVNSSGVLQNRPTGAKVSFEVKQ